MFTHLKYSHLMFAGILLLFPSLVFGQNGQAPVLDDLISEALLSNPGLEAVEQRWQASRQLRPQMSSYDDPMFSYTRWLRSPETRVGPQENVLMFSQRIPFPGKLGVKGKFADEIAGADEAQYKATARDVVFNVKRAYYDLYRVDQSLRILDDYLVLLRNFTRVAEQKYVTGEGIQASVLKSQVEISMILDRKLSFERQRAGIVARINALRDRPADTPMGRAATIDPGRYTMPESLVVQYALAARQELHAADARIRQSEFGVRLAHLAYKPDFNVQASYISVPKKSSQFSDSGKDAFSIMVGVNIPIRLKRRRAAVSEANARVEANRLTRENIENTVSAEIMDFYFQMKNTATTLDLYDQGLILQAESSLESALSAYQTGKLNFLDLLDAERMLLQVRLGYAREQSNYARSLAALEWAAGGELP